MPQKLTQTQVQQRLQQKHYTLLTRYKDSISPITVLCSAGHRWKTTLYRPLVHSCPQCVIKNRIRKTEHDYKILAKLTNLKWVGDFPKLATYTTNWKCPQKHVFKRSYCAIRQGQKACPICTDQIIKNENHYRNLAKSLNIKWLGTLPKTTTDPSKWKCSQGHIYTTTYEIVSRKNKCKGCRKCTINRRGEDAPHWNGGKRACATRRRIQTNGGQKILSDPEWEQHIKKFRSKCVYCGQKPQKIEQDHFLPVVRGGKHIAQNLVPACRNCNGRKSAKHPKNWLISIFGEIGGLKKYNHIKTILKQCVN